MRLAFAILLASVGVTLSATLRIDQLGASSARGFRQTFRTEEGAVTNANVVINGSFDTDSDWIKPTGGTISGGKANWTQNGAFRQNTTLEGGNYYEIRYTISDYTSGAFRVQGWVPYACYRYGPGNYRDILFIPSDSTALFIEGSDTAVASVSEITVKKITPINIGWYPRKVAFAGDSIATNACLNYPDIFPGDTTYGHSLASAGITIMNYASGGQTFASILSSGIPLCAASGAKTILVHCGVNDISQGRTWAQVESDLDAIRLLVTTQDLFIDEILPWTAGNDTQAALVRTWNGNLATWCSANNATLISSHDPMGQIRISTGQLDDLKTIYDADGVHPGTGGYYALWSIWCAALESFYGVPVRP